MTGFYAMDKAGKMNRVSADEAFPFLAETGHTVSLVGAGGKTTLMFILADFCCKRGMKVLVSTTTHILKPEDGSYIENEKQLWDRWNSGKPAVAGQPDHGSIIWY